MKEKNFVVESHAGLKASYKTMVKTTPQKEKAPSSVPPGGKGGKGGRGLGKGKKMSSSTKAGLYIQSIRRISYLFPLIF